MAAEYYKKYRPRKLSQLYGCPSVVTALEQYLSDDELPQALLFIGDSGCGKTTTARILRTRLGCNNDFDYEEMNCANLRGIDDIRKINDRIGLAPAGGKCRMYVLDEAHQLLAASQSMLLKMLEDTPAHVYFVLCTNIPEKLLKTIHTRCAAFKFSALDKGAMRKLLDSVCEQEKKPKVSEPVLVAILEASEGSARKALNILQNVVQYKEEAGQLAAVQKEDIKKTAIELARALHNPAAKWPEIAAFIKACDEEPETVRRTILGYANSVMLGGGKLASRAYFIAEAFERNWFDTGKVGLTKACWEVSKQS